MSSTNFLYEGGKYVSHKVKRLEPSRTDETRGIKRYSVSVIGELPKDGGKFDVSGQVSITDDIDAPITNTVNGLGKMWHKRVGKLPKFKTALTETLNEVIRADIDNA